MQLIGDYLELLYSGGGTTSMLEILPTAGAWKLGFLPQASIGEKSGRDPSLARCLSIRRGPFNLAPGDTIEYRRDNGAVERITFMAGG